MARASLIHFALAPEYKTLCGRALYRKGGRKGRGSVPKFTVEPEEISCKHCLHILDTNEWALTKDVAPGKPTGYWTEKESLTNG